MAGDIAPTPIAELIDNGVLAINDGYRAKNSELSPQGIPFARAQNINNGFHFAGADCFPEQDLAKVGIKISQAEDVVFTSKGTVGRFAFVRHDTPRFVYAPQLCFWRVLNRDCLDPRWLYYWMHSREFFVQFSGVAGQTDMAEYVSLRDQRRMYITIPPLEQQRAIACILGALDDKIELNRRMNQTLEAIARAIFKSWFVDFDPVHAKAQGRNPNLPKDVADLFPDSFENSELGEIPKGWRIGKISDIANINALTLGRRDHLDVIDYIEISEVMHGEVGIISRYLRGEEPSRARRRLSHGDTVLSTVRPDRGAYFLALNPSKSLIASTGFAALTPKDGNWAFLHIATTRPEFGQELGRLADGGAYPAIRPEVVGSRDIVLPDNSQLIATFDKNTQPLFLRAEVNRNESRALAAIRDALLPKLISGELRLPKMEAVK